MVLINYLREQQTVRRALTVFWWWIDGLDFGKQASERMVEFITDSIFIYGLFIRLSH